MRRRISPSSGSKIHTTPEEGESACTSFWPLSFLPLLHFSIFFSSFPIPGSQNFLWPFLEYWSISLSSFESKDSWRYLPAMSSLFQPFPMKSQIISSSRVFKKTYFAEKLFLANIPLDAKQVSGLVLSKDNPSLHTSLCANKTHFKRRWKDSFLELPRYGDIKKTQTCEYRKMVAFFFLK